MITSSRIKKSLHLIYRFGLVLLLLSGCGGGQEEGGSSSVQIVLNPPGKPSALSKVSRAPEPSEISFATLEVSGPGMAPLSVSTSLSSGTETRLNLEVPAGAGRRFVVTMNDGAGTPRFRGEATADLIPGTSPLITIVMVAIRDSIPTTPDSIPTTTSTTTTVTTTTTSRTATTTTTATPPPTTTTTQPPILLISPSAVVVPKSATQTFTVSGVDPAGVNWGVEGGPNFGQITPGGIYTAPSQIPTDAATPIGNPAPAVIFASSKVNPQVQDSALATVVTGPTIAFEKNLPVSRTSGTISTDSAGQRSIAFYQGHVYLVWSDALAGILFAESADGINWNLSTVPGTPGIQPEPTLAVGPDGTIYVAYQGRRASSCQLLVCPPPPSIELAALRPGAGKFELLTPLMVGFQAETPTVAVSPDATVSVAWSAHGNGGTADIFFQRVNQDGTLVDSSPRNLTEKNGAFNETRPALAVSDVGDLFLGWEVSANARDIVATLSQDGGNSFFPESQINDVVPGKFEFALRPSLAAGPDGTVYVAWENDTCTDGCTFISFDVGRPGPNGLLFGGDQLIGSGIKAVRQFRPSIAWDGANGIDIAFQESVSGIGDEIFLAKSTNVRKGFTFSQVSRDDTTVVSTKSAPSVAVDAAGRPFAIWSDNRRTGAAGTDLFFSKGE